MPDPNETDQAPQEDEAREPRRRRFPIVGIGASAGGLEALEALVERLSQDSMAYVVLQHLAPGHESLLTEILTRHSLLKTVTVRDGLEVEVNTIYVAAPASEVTLEDGVFRVRAAEQRPPRMLVDALFRSLARTAGDHAIGVVLSGAGSDGVLGLRAIKEEGGITFAQDPSTAMQPSMPQTAIDAGAADFVLTAAEIGDELMRLSAHPYVARVPPPQLLGVEARTRLFEQLRRGFGVDFSAYKLPTVERRIQRRMALQQIEATEDYLRLVEHSAQELGALFADLLIGVTGFFRDVEPFDALRRVVFPRLLERQGTEGNSIRIWVPGCATGEEVYSIAIVLFEALQENHKGTTIQIFGTDIDEAALARARVGIYPANIEVDVSPERLQRFFVRTDRGYQVSRQLRDVVVFARHNLARDPPFSRLDLISCRNVLIYMQPALQRKLLRTFHYALNAISFLMLGKAESVGEAADLFTLHDRKLKLYTKKSGLSPGVLDFSFRPAAVTGARAAESAPPTERRGGVTAQQIADRKVLDRFGPAGLILDEKLDVLQFRGNLAPYLAPSPGTATLNVLKLVRPELLVALRTALADVARDALPIAAEPVALAGAPPVMVEVMPLGEPSGQRCALVLFREVTDPVPLPSALPTGEPSELQRRVLELERELLVTKEYLKTTVAELEAANEELQSANEELQSANEELQSTNEELETSKEELQSTNEELATVNEELQNRMVQLSTSNDDLRNVFNDVSTPLVIVGHDMRIRRFSNAAGTLLNLGSGDLGRPIAYLGTSLNAPHIAELVGESIRTVRPQVQRVRCSDGRWYSLRATAYRTSDDAIRGAVLEFLRSPPTRKLGELPEVHELAAKLLSSLPHALLLLDDQLRVVWANTALFDAFQFGAEIVGEPLDDLWNRDDEPALWTAIESRAPFAPTRVPKPFGRDRPMKVSLQFLSAEGDRPTLTLLLLEGAGV